MAGWMVVATQELTSWANVTPPPANMAMMAVASFLRITQKVAEGHKLAKEHRLMVNKMAKKACDVAYMIQGHASELKNNHVFKAMVEEIRGVVNELHEFAESCQRQNLARRVWSSEKDKSKLLELHHQIDSAVVHFTAKMEHLSHSSGPHQLIKHMDVRTFWKYRMKDEIHDMPWKQFWDHFLDEHKDIKERYFKIDPAGSKAKIEGMSRTPGFVSAYDISLIFNSPTRSIDWHIQKALGSTTSYQISKPHMFTKVRTNILREEQSTSNLQQVYEMQTWRGKYTIHNCSISISANLIFLRFARQLQGSGDDEKHGHFSCQGFLITEQHTTEASILVKCETNDRPDILFKGYIIHDCGKTRIEGSCICPPDATEACGAFDLELIGTDIHPH